MTTTTSNTPAQQLEEVLVAFEQAGTPDAIQLAMSDCSLYLIVHAPTLHRALAALEAVEGGVRAEFSVLDNDRGWLIDGADNDAQAARLDALSKLHAPVLIIPADAVEVSRG